MRESVTEVLSKNYDDEGYVIEVWIKTRNADKNVGKELRELHVRYIKQVLLSKDKWGYPVQIPTIKLIEWLLPSGLPVLWSHKMLEIDYSLRRRCFLLAWSILWPNLPPPPIVKKEYYGIILEGYKKGVKPERYTRYAVSEDNAREIIRHAYNRDHGFPDDHWVLMRTGEVTKKKKPKPRKLFKDY